VAISDWPYQERPREKLLAKGAAALSDAELVAIFLRSGVSGKTALDVGRELLANFDGLRGLLEASEHDLCRSAGLGPAKFAQLQAALELGRRHLNATLSRSDALTDVETTRKYLSARLRHRQHEVFACLFLDNRHRVIEFEELFQGSIASASVYPRQVVKRALHYNAAAVILAHNHPSGVADPSHADEEITRKLKQSLALIDVRVLDHFVVGDAETVSFSERGLL